MLLLLFFFLAGALAQDITYNEMKGYRCYTPKDQYNTKDMKCGAAIKEHRSCEEMSQSAKTFAREEKPPFGFKMAKGKRYCDITFIGRCASETFSRGAHDLCFTVNTRRATYRQAVEDCESHGGSLFVPDSDYELGKLIDIFDGKIRRFWLGGGSIFFRTCRDASIDENEETAVVYTVMEGHDRLLGYSTTRNSTYRAQYVCAMPKKRGNRSCFTVDGPAGTREKRVLNFVSPYLKSLPTTIIPSTTTVPPPPRCSFVETVRSGAARVIEACFNDGPLQIDDTLVVEGVTPQCCPDIGEDDAAWSINLHSKEKAPWFHYGIQNGWQRMVWTTATEDWGAGWSDGRNYNCPFKPSSNFTMEVTNKQGGFEVRFNGKSYSEAHPVAGDHGNQYFYVAFFSYSPVKIYSAGVVRNGEWNEISLGVAV